MSMWLVLGKKKLSRGTLLLWEEWIGLCWTDLGIKAISRFSSICLCCYGFWAGINSAKPGQPVINIMMMMSIWTGLDHVPTDCRSSEMPILLHIVWTWTPKPTHPQMPILLHIVWTWTPTPPPHTHTDANTTSYSLDLNTNTTHTQHTHNTHHTPHNTQHTTHTDRQTVHQWCSRWLKRWAYCEFIKKLLWK